MNQDTCGVDDLTVGWTGRPLKIDEDVSFEGFTGDGDFISLDGALGDEAAETIDRRPTRFHDRRSTEALDGLQHRREFE